MAKESPSNSQQDKREPEPIRRRDGREELPEEMSQNLQNAVWAGLAQKMQTDKVLLCKQHGHQWIEGPDKTTVCKRCGVEKVADEEIAENSPG